MPILGWIIVIFIICLFVYSMWFQDRKPKEPMSLKILDESNGTFDRPAAVALETINNEPKPTARERIARADILRFNVAEDTINDEAIAAALAEDYMEGALDADTPEIADIAAGRIRTLIGGNNAATVAATIEGRYAAAVAANAAENANVSRKAAARAQTKDRTGAARVYLKSSSTIADDRQNVHDTLANKDMRETLRRIGNGSIEPAIAIANARVLLSDPAWRAENPDIDVGKAEAALNLISQANVISTFGTSEDRIFASVWSRAHHGDNILVEKELKTSIAHALADCIEGSGPVCINGRCARLIGSLAAIDRDPKVGAIGTFDTYKAKIIAESSRIMEKKLEELRQNDPAEVAKWEAGDQSPVSKVLADAISNHVDGYRGEIPDIQLENIRSTCVLAVE